jgi:hypothetical protein
MLHRPLVLLCAIVGVVVAVDDEIPTFDLRLELALASPPRRVHDEFTNGGSAAVPSGTYTADIDASPTRIARVIAASASRSRAGGLLWGFGGEYHRDRFRIADPPRGGSALHVGMLGGFAMLGWAWAPSRALELEIDAYGGVGYCRAGWISPDVSAGTTSAVGDGGYAEEGVRVAVGAAVARVLMQAFVGLEATQAGADVDFDTGDSSRLRLDSGGWTIGLAAGYRF